MRQVAPVSTPPFGKRSTNKRANLHLTIPRRCFGSRPRTETQPALPPRKSSDAHENGVCATTVFVLAKYRPGPMHVKPHTRWTRTNEEGRKMGAERYGWFRVHFSDRHLSAFKSGPRMATGSRVTRAAWEDIRTDEGPPRRHTPMSIKQLRGPLSREPIAAPGWKPGRKLGSRWISPCPFPHPTHIPGRAESVEKKPETDPPTDSQRPRMSRWTVRVRPLRGFLFLM